jgi:mutator family transposase
MSTEIDSDHELIETVHVGSAGGLRGEPGGRAQRPAGAARPLEVDLRDEFRDRLSDEVIDELLAGARTEEEIVGPGGVLAQLTKRLVERALSAELTEYLGYEPHQEPPGGVGNTRNGSTAKTLATKHGPVEVRTPRDRNSSFEPQIVRKGQRRFEGTGEVSRLAVVVRVCEADLVVAVLGRDRRRVAHPIGHPVAVKDRPAVPSAPAGRTAPAGRNRPMR